MAEEAADGTVAFFRDVWAISVFDPRGDAGGVRHQLAADDGVDSMSAASESSARPGRHAGQPDGWGSADGGAVGLSGGVSATAAADRGPVLRRGRGLATAGHRASAALGEHRRLLVVAPVPRGSSTRLGRLAARPEGEAAHAGGAAKWSGRYTVNHRADRKSTRLNSSH